MMSVMIFQARNRVFYTYQSQTFLTDPIEIEMKHICWACLVFMHHGAQVFKYSKSCKSFDTLSLKKTPRGS